MPIDQYEDTFEHLASTDLPRHLAELEVDMRVARPMADFAVDGDGPRALCQKYGLEDDFPGCYVLIENGKPIYVGISRTVLARLRQHVRGTTHSDASLAYRIAAHRMPHPYTRAKAMDAEEFKEQFAAAKEYLRNLDVAYVKIINPLALYVFEPYCAMRFDTSTWNTFATH